MKLKDLFEENSLKFKMKSNMCLMKLKKAKMGE
jgi:hypothetical protein